MNGLHYHNSVKSSSTSGEYVPTSDIKTELLTNKYVVSDNIGRGKFAVVKKCTHKDTGEAFAAKFIKKRRRGKTCREEILREVVMLEMALDHPRLVDLKEVYESPTELILITEYCSGGELFTECVVEESFKESDVKKYMVQILEGLCYLHEKCIVHLDLKPQNILLTRPFPEGDIKLCDLGFACLVNTGEDIRDIIGTPDYVAPEVLSYEPLGLYTDMWSVGVLTYVMLTTCSPFAGETKQETFLNISTVKLDFPDSLFSSISSAAQDFIRKLLIIEPKDRMTAQDCLKHPWLTGLFSPSTSPIATTKDNEVQESHDLSRDMSIDDLETVSDSDSKVVSDSESENFCVQSEDVSCKSEMQREVLVEDQKLIDWKRKSVHIQFEKTIELELTSDRGSISPDVEDVEFSSKSASETSVKTVLSVSSVSQGVPENDFNQNRMESEYVELNNTPVKGDNSSVARTCASSSSTSPSKPNEFPSKRHKSNTEPMETVVSHTGLINTTESSDSVINCEENLPNPPLRFLNSANASSGITTCLISIEDPNNSQSNSESYC